MEYTVQLTKEEMQQCKEAAELTIKNGEEKCRNDFTVGSHYRNNLIGAGAELALSALLGIPTVALNFDGRDAGDVANIESRSTENPAYNLRVNERDAKGKKLGRSFVFSRHIKAGLYQFVGWHFGWFVWQNGKTITKDHPQKDGRVVTSTMKWIPDSELRLMDEVICVARGWPVGLSVRGYDQLEKLRLDNNTQPMS